MMLPRWPFRAVSRHVSIAAICTFVLIFTAAPATAILSVYPDTSKFDSVSSREIFRVVDEDGVWFTSPLGVPCAIEDDGSYGCSGILPGVRAGENEIAWFVGDPFPRVYATNQPRFDSGAGQTILLGRTYIEYRGSRCGTTRESWIYCIHGDDPNSQLLVTSTSVFRGADGVPGS
jgi:hypothetical protein